MREDERLRKKEGGGVLKQERQSLP